MSIYTYSEEASDVPRSAPDPGGQSGEEQKLPPAEPATQPQIPEVAKPPAQYAPLSIPAGFVANTRQRKLVIKGNQKRPGCWLVGPATMTLFKSTDHHLLKVAALRELHVGEVQKVRLLRELGSKLIHIIPTHELDIDGLDINRHKGKIWVNIIDFLAEDHLTVEYGYKERYDLVLAPTSKVGPCLLLDLTRMLERKLAFRQKKGGGTAAKPKTDSAKPGTGTPGTGTAGTGTPGTGTAGTGTAGAGTPGTDAPGTGTAGTDAPGTDAPGTGTPGTASPGSPNQDAAKSAATSSPPETQAKQ